MSIFNQLFRSLSSFIGAQFTFTPAPVFRLLSLPPEIIFNIADTLTTFDLATLLRVSPLLQTELTPLLYQRAITLTRPSISTHFQWCPTPGRSILHFAAAHADTKLLSALLIRLGSHTCLLDARDLYGHTPLISAVLWGHKDIVRMLLAAGADVKKATSKYVWSPLHCACAAENLEMAQILVAAGADTEQSDTFAEMTPLHLMVLSSVQPRYEMRGFVQLGCSEDQKDQVGVEPRRSMELLECYYHRDLGEKEWARIEKHDNSVVRLLQQRMTFKSRMKARLTEMFSYEMDRCRWCVRGEPWKSLNRRTVHYYIFGELYLVRRAHSGSSGCDEVMVSEYLAKGISSQGW